MKNIFINTLQQRLPKKQTGRFYTWLASSFLTFVMFGGLLFYAHHLGQSLFEQGVFSSLAVAQWGLSAMAIALAWGVFMGLFASETRQAAGAGLKHPAQGCETWLESLPTAVYQQDLAGRFLRVNTAFELLFGVDRAAFLGKDAADLATFPFAGFFSQPAHTNRDAASLHTCEAQFLSLKTGLLSDGMHARARVVDAAGNGLGWAGTIHDVTESKQAKRALNKDKHLAEVANQAKSEFLANISHEIRTPLSGMMGMTDLALEMALDATQQSYLTLAKSSAQSLMQMLNDILDLSKMESGLMALEVVEFSLPVLITDSLNAFAELTHKKGLVLDIHMAPDLPAFVMGDPVRVQQVLTNLLSNALKFTKKGRISVTAGAFLLEGNNFELRMSVSDTGVGIPAQLQKSVFAAFSQADASNSRRYGGTGLGLAISARLLALMGGRLGLESQEGVGSTFSFTLSLPGAQARSDENPAAPPNPVVKLQDAAVGEIPMHVLVVDDHLVNQILCKTMLQKMGCVVTIGNNGEEATVLFGERAWDLVLMDMQMPVMDGLEATRQIRLSEPVGQRTPIVAMTANVMASDHQACLAAGMDDYMSKPFKSATLQALLNRLVQRDPVIEGLK